MKFMWLVNVFESFDKASLSFEMIGLKNKCNFETN